MRYVDDMVLLARDQTTLVRWCAAIERFLGEQLKLVIRPEMTAPFAVKKGIDFVGWKTWWNRRAPRRRTVVSLHTRLADFEQKAVRSTRHGIARCIDLQRSDQAYSVDRLRATLASYSGHLRHGAAWDAWTKVWKQYPWLQTLFVRDGWVIRERWSRPRAAKTQGLKTQYANLLRYAGQDCLVFFPFGRFIEFYGPQRLLAAPLLGLNTVFLPRAVYTLMVGFPACLSTRYARLALRQGLTVVFVGQISSLINHASKARVPHRVWLPA